MSRSSVTHLYYGGGFTEYDINNICIMTQEQKWLSYVAELRSKHEAEMHEYAKELQGKILDQEFTIKSLVEDNRALKEAIEINCNCNADGCHNSRLLNNLEGRANALEEWLTEYRDQLKKENVYHKNTGIINAINELLNETSTDI